MNEHTLPKKRCWVILLVFVYLWHKTWKALNI